MKFIRVILPQAVVITCLCLAGCSKPEDAASRAGTISTDSSSEPVSMKIKWTPGKRYEKQWSLDHTAKMDMPGMKKPMDQQMTFVHSFSIETVKALPNGGSEMQMTFTGDKMESKTDGRQDAKFDSNDDPKNDKSGNMGPSFRKMIGVHINYETDAGGKVDKLLNYADFTAQVAGTNRGSQEMVKTILSEDLLKKLAMPGACLPDQPVKIGDHWLIHADYNFGMMGAFTTDAKYTFKGWQQHDGRKCAVLGCVGEIKKKSGGNMGGMNMTFEKCTLLGDTWFDPAEGVVVDSVSEIELNIKMVSRGKTSASTMKEKVGNKLVDVADIAK